MTRKALIVGIDGYPRGPLRGCVNDAQAMNTLLSRNENGDPNFECRSLTIPAGTGQLLSAADLKREVKDLFSDPSDVALFYFSGHGHVDVTGGALVTTDAAQFDEGLAMSVVMTLANQSKAKDRIVLLDCCHAAAFGAVPQSGGVSEPIFDGVTVMSASREDQYAVERGGRGVFTSLICGALSGGAADVRGLVTPGSVYAYVDEALGAWGQRPGFKTNVSRFTVLRKCKPSVSLVDLRRITEFFATPGVHFPLDPSYEPTVGLKNADHEAVFKILQMYNRSRLVVPVGAEHMYFAAMESKSCALTPIGHQYWRMAKENRL